MEAILKYFNYDKEAGKLYWTDKKKWVKPGTEAGGKVGDYIRVKIDGKSYPIHHVIWFFEFGYRPNEIDHINQNKTDNRICNLREVPHSENQKNHPKYKSNTSGVTGVSFHKRVKKWEARIQRKCLGYFDKFEDAVKVRKEAEIHKGFHKNHGI